MVELVEFIDNLREQLTEARNNAEEAAQNGNPVRMAVKSAKVELTVSASKEGGANGKVKFSVLGIGAEVGGSGKISKSGVQKLTLELDVTDADTGTTVLIDSGQQPGPTD